MINNANPISTSAKVQNDRIPNLNNATSKPNMTNNQAKENNFGSGLWSQIKALETNLASLRERQHRMNGTDGPLQQSTVHDPMRCRGHTGVQEASKFIQAKEGRHSCQSFGGGIGTGRNAVIANPGIGPGESFTGKLVKQTRNPSLDIDEARAGTQERGQAGANGERRLPRKESIPRSTGKVWWQSKKPSTWGCGRWAWSAEKIPGQTADPVPDPVDHTKKHQAGDDGSEPRIVAGIGGQLARDIEDTRSKLERLDERISQFRGDRSYTIPSTPKARTVTVELDKDHGEAARKAEGAGPGRQGRAYGVKKSITEKVATALLMSCLVINATAMEPLEDLLKIAHKSKGPRCDFAEVCCSPESALTETMKEKSFNTQRINLSEGYNLEKKLEAQAAQLWIAEHRPRKTWVSTECTPHTRMQNINQRTPQQIENLRRKRMRSYKVISQAVMIGCLTIALGGDLYWEWPEWVSSWGSKEMQVLYDFAEKNNITLYKVKTRGCRVGLTDEYGVLSGKAWVVLTTDKQFAEEMELKCKCWSSHAWLHGKALAKSAYYPPAYVKRATNIFEKQLRPPVIWSEVVANLTRWYPEEDEVKDNDNKEIEFKNFNFEKYDFVTEEEPYGQMRNKAANATEEESLRAVEEQSGVMAEKNGNNFFYNPEPTEAEITDWLIEFEDYLYGKDMVEITKDLYGVIKKDGKKRKLGKAERNITKPQDARELKKIEDTILKLHKNAGHSRKSALKAFMRRKDCPRWMIDMVDDLKCDECDANKESMASAPPASLAEPPKVWQVLGTDPFELTTNESRTKFVIYMDWACKLASCSTLHEGPLEQAWEPKTTLLIEKLLEDWMQHFPKMQWIFSDPAGQYVGREFREWCGASGIGLMTTPGEAHEALGSVENLIRIIKRTARRLLDEGHTPKVAMLMAIVAHNNQAKETGYAPVSWAFGAAADGERIEGLGVLSGLGIAQREMVQLKAEQIYLEEKANEKFSQAMNTINRKLKVAAVGQLVYYWRLGKNADPGWLGPAVVCLLEPTIGFEVTQPRQSEGVDTSRPRVIWVTHGGELLRCSLRQLREATKKEKWLAQMKGLVPLVMPESMDDLMAKLRHGTYTDISGEVPSQDEIERAAVNLREEYTAPTQTTGAGSAPTAETGIFRQDTPPASPTAPATTPRVRRTGKQDAEGRLFQPDSVQAPPLPSIPPFPQLQPERLEQEQLEPEQLEPDQLEPERLEQERLEQERLEQEQLEPGGLEPEFPTTRSSTSKRKAEESGHRCHIEGCVRPSFHDGEHEDGQGNVLPDTAKYIKLNEDEEVKLVVYLV